MPDGETGTRTAAQWGAVRLGVHPAPGPDGSVDLMLPDYLPRPHDETLRQRLTRAAATNDAVFVLLVGRSSSGKTRAVYEAVAAVLPDWPVLHPVDADELIAEDVGPRTVLWLDEAQRYLSGATGEGAARQIGRLLDKVAPLAVVGTMWPEHLRRFAESRDEAPHAWALLTGRHPTVTVPDTLPGDSPAVAAAAARDPRIAAAVRAAGATDRVLQHLTGGPELVRRWDMGPDQWFTAPEHAVLTAAVEARRLGHAGAVPARLLMEAAVGFMDSGARATAGKEWFPAAVSALTAPGRGPAPLIAERHGPGVGDPDSYRPDDYVEQHIRRVRAHRAPPAEFWTGAAWARTPDDLYAFGRAAEQRRRYSCAAALYENAVRQGHSRARTAWAVLRETTDGPAAAEETAATDPGAWAALAVSRENLGDRQAAYDAYLRASEAGDAWAWSAMARIREEEGDPTAADAVAALAAHAGQPLAWRTLGRMRAAHGPAAAKAFEQAVSVGDGWGHMGLAQVAERGGEIPEAVEHAGRAAAAGVTAAWALLVRLHWALGDPASAVTAATAGAAAGNPEGWSLLAQLRYSEGDLSGAAAAHREAAALGVGAAWRELALLAESEGDLRAAEEAAAQAVRTGDPEAWTALAEARQERGDDTGAAHAATEAARAGDVEAWINLARARERAGDTEGAETAADLAADRGSPAAWAALSRMRERADDRDGSRRAVLRASALGAYDAWTALGRVREARGDVAAAERAYLRGCEAGDTEAYAALGALCLEQGRTADACTAYRSAVDAGLPDAWEGLLSALAAKAPRPASAQMVERLRREGLPPQD
ncbi:tetratricopeptide repeat protein [Streptomyces sp. NPDC003635]